MPDEEPRPAPEPPRRTFKELMADYERRIILRALEDTGWHQRRAAKKLGVLPTTLLEKMKRLGIRRRRTPLEEG